MLKHKNYHGTRAIAIYTELVIEIRLLLVRN